VGSSFALKVTENAGRLTLLREPRVDFIDDGPGKPIGIARHIGRRPIAAFGNSDGDFIGRLARALDAAPARGWHVVSMRDDWARVFE
jgi:hypothetical protein